jgi:hypothetical protein
VHKRQKRKEGEGGLWYCGMWYENRGEVPCETRAQSAVSHRVHNKPRIYSTWQMAEAEAAEAGRVLWFQAHNFRGQNPLRMPSTLRSAARTAGWRLAGLRCLTTKSMSNSKDTNKCQIHTDWVLIKQ